jgi:rubrerythrin
VAKVSERRKETGSMPYNFNVAEVFDVAIKIEENGKRFYEQSLNVIKDAGVRKLFQDLASQEMEHKAKFEELKSKFSKDDTAPTVWDPENEIDQYLKMLADQHVFVSSESLDIQMKTIKDVKDALKMAMGFEKDSVIFFLTMQEAVSGKREEELVSVLVKEEQQHLRLLAAELNRLSK